MKGFYGSIPQAMASPGKPGRFGLLAKEEKSVYDFRHAEKDIIVVPTLHAKRNVYLAIPLVTAVILWPIFVAGFPNGHDGQFHLVWMHHFSTQFLGGELYPRWLTDMSYGLGSPTFYYYPPLGYWLGSLGALVLDSRTQGHYILAFATWITFSIGSLGTWHVARAWLNERGAILAALAFAVLPYHLLFNVYIRAGFAELTAFAVLPFLLMGIDQLPHRIVARFLISVAATAALVLAHPLTAVVAVPLTTSWQMFSAWRYERCLSEVLWPLAGSLLGMLCASFYIVPALLIEIPPDVPENLGWETYRVEEYYLGDRLSRNSLMNLVQHAVFISTAALACIAFALSLILCKRNRSLPASFLCLALFATFMLMPNSAFIYSLIPPLQRLQFPWRYTIVLTLLAAIGAGWLYVIADRLTHRIAQALRVVLILFLLGSLALSWIVSFMSHGNPRFDAQFTTELIAKSVDAIEYRHSPLASGDTPVAQVALSGGGGEHDIRVERWTPWSIVLRGDFFPGQRYILGRQYFGDWYEWGGVPGAYVKRSESGLVEVTVHAPRDTLHLDRAPFPAEFLGRRLSLMGIALVLFGALLRSRRLPFFSWALPR